jgi:outer membrane protein TolC
MKIKAYIIILFLISAHLYPQSRLTLSNAITKGLENNYGLRISKKSVDISKENNTWGNAGMYPSIDLGIRSINRFDYSEDPETEITTNNIAPSAQLNWVLFNGFRVLNTKDRLEEQQKLSEGLNAVAVESTIQDIILTYYDVLLQKERLRVFQELEGLSKDRYERAEASREIGGSVTFDVLQAKTAWLEDKASVLSQKLNFDNSIRALNLLIGVKEDVSYEEFDEFETEIRDYNYRELREKMMLSNKTLKNQYINEMISKRSIDIAGGGMYPSLSLSAGYDYLTSRQKVSGFPRSTDKSYDYYGNLTLNLNIFDGLNTKRALEIAKIQHEIDKIETEEIAHTLNNVLDRLYQLYKIQKDLINVAEENLAAAKLNFEISEEKFKNGSINSFNFRDAQIVYLNASLQRLSSIYNLINTDTEIARITGSIITEK